MDAEEIKTELNNKMQYEELVDVEHLMIVWIVFITIGIVLDGIGSRIYSAFGVNLGSYLLSVGNFIIIYPGPLILAVIIGAILGRRIGKLSSYSKKAIDSSLINGGYGVIIYLISIGIIYVIMSYFGLLNQSFNVVVSVFENVAYPVIIFISSTILFSVITFFRRIKTRM